MKLRLLFAAIVLVSFRAWPAAAAPAQLVYVAIISRHGVRAPGWEAARLNEYSSEPWPKWGVPPDYLTPHGRAAIKRMGAYYRDWLVSQRLIHRAGCQDVSRVYIWADTDERTLETGRAFAVSLLPGCGLNIHSLPKGKKDSLFSGTGTKDPRESIEALRNRLDPDSRNLLAKARPSLATLQDILSDGMPTKKQLPPLPAQITASRRGKKTELNGPFHIASSLTEDLLLEYTDGMRGKDLGWGRLTKQDLNVVLELHAIYADLTRRTPYLARARGSNLLEHVLLSIEQAESGKKVPGALGAPEDRVLILVGHDTNLSNLSGMLGLSWHLAGYVENATPPGGALVFSLWRDALANRYFVRTQFIAQSLDQMRDAAPLTMSSPPVEQDLEIPGCDSLADDGGCSSSAFKATLQRAIDPAFVSERR